MSHLPIIVGFGGISPAGRSSFHQAYRRMVFDALLEEQPQAVYESYTDLAILMGLVTYTELGYLISNQDESEVITSAEIFSRYSCLINESTLIRKIEKSYLDIYAVPWQQASNIAGKNGESISFELKTSTLPKPIPENWSVTEIDKQTSHIKVFGTTPILLPSTREFIVKSAGQLPSGINFSKRYPARHHPRGLQMTVYAASDALQSMGIEWEHVEERVAPDKISVYASSAMSQLDEDGNGGLMGSRLKGKKVSSKHLALGLTEMPADFINAYLLGGLGSTGGNTGACASFLYNLKKGVEDIQRGQSRVAIIGGAEAPITAEIIDGYATMGALATAENLRKLDANQAQPNYKRACRPFSDNCGFTLAESAQVVILFDDALAMELAATIHGAIDQVFVNADGYKKSISSPGLGNWITVAKALASARALLGERSLQRSYMHAHGTGTPQNRVSESSILNETAKTYGIKNWMVTGVKSYLGHSIGTSAGDQLMATLGTWQHGIIPGITSIDHIADDVQNSYLNILMTHQKVNPLDIDVTFLNAKGFGGNNATAGVLAPHIVKAMLKGKYGTEKMTQYERLNTAVLEKSSAYNQACLKGQDETLYRFDYNVLQGQDIEYTAHKIRVPGWGQSIDLDLESPYSDMLK
jgi:acetoacetyl-[acyl-carrier protein] synthase